MSQDIKAEFEKEFPNDGQRFYGPFELRQAAVWGMKYACKISQDTRVDAYMPTPTEVRYEIAKEIRLSAAQLESGE